MSTTTDANLKPRRGSPSARRPEGDFKRRAVDQSRDAAYRRLSLELAKVLDAAWDANAGSRTCPETRKAGPAFHDPDYDLADDWLTARKAIRAAQEHRGDGPLRALLINGSSRREHACPGELSKGFRKVEMAKAVLEDSPRLKATCAKRDIKHVIAGCALIPAWEK